MTVHTPSDTYHSLCVIEKWDYRLKVGSKAVGDVTFRVSKDARGLRESNQKPRGRSSVRHFTICGCMSLNEIRLGCCGQIKSIYQ